jgi:hypothetical protein
VVELLSVTVLDVVEEASLLMTNDQVKEPHQPGSVIVKSVKWSVVNSTYGTHHIITTSVFLYKLHVNQLSVE